MQNTSVAQQWIYANHRENTSSSVVVFTARCIATEIIRFLPVYSFLRECVYQVVALQRVYMSQYLQQYFSIGETRPTGGTSQLGGLDVTN
jgi:hypothetical protein